MVEFWHLPSTVAVPGCFVQCFCMLVWTAAHARQKNSFMFFFLTWIFGSLKPSRLSTGPGPAWPPSPHFYRQGLGQPSPQPLTFINSAWVSPAPKPSLLSTGPGPAWHPTPHCYWSDPSLLSARLSRRLAAASNLRGPLLRKESLSEQNRHRDL